MFHAVLLAAQLVVPGDSIVVTGPCRDDELSGPTRSLDLILQGYDDVEIIPVEGDPPPHSRSSSDPCRAWKLARAALIGWSSARELAKKGGALELLGPVRTILETQLETFRGGDLRLEAEYAQTAIRAAIAAAQDERPELELLLTHAMDLSQRLIARGRRALWPRPLNIVAGELWLEVDRHEEARAAFERATRADGGAVALVGLARAHAQLGHRADACAAYRQVSQAAPALLNEARTFLESCQ